MRKVAIISDDTCDLPAELLEKYQITIIPNKVIFSDKVFTSCGVQGELTLDEYYRRAEKELPTTSIPAPGTIHQAFDRALKNADTVIALFISKHMSPIADSARNVIKQFFPDKDIRVFDTKVTSVALALVVLEAAIMAQEGHSVEKINSKVEEWLEQIHYAGIMSTLENLVRTGRVPKSKKFLADFFKVKPIVKFVEGQVAVQGKMRADDQLIVSQMKRFGKNLLENINGESNYVFIGHTRWPEAAEEIAAYMKEHNPEGKEIIIQETGAIVANYVGRKTLTIGYLGEYNNDWLLNTKDA
ncbi:MAG: DegV family protein [Candidatus Thorarchaeota archaeon]